MLWRATRPLAVLALTWVVGCAGAPATPEVRGTQADPPSAREIGLSQRADEYVAQFGQHWGESFRFNGYVIVARDGQPLYSRGFGTADADGRPFEGTRSGEGLRRAHRAHTLAT